MATQQQQPHSSELLDAPSGFLKSQKPQNWPEQPRQHGSAEHYDPSTPYAPPLVSESVQPAYQPVARMAAPPTIQRDVPLYFSEEPLKPSKEQQLPAQHPARRRYHGGGWGAEITCAVLSIICVIAIVVILSRVDGRLLSSWTIAVSPNAIIAVLSTAAKAAMIFPVTESISQLKWLYLKRRALGLEHLQEFDNASRGPWGALKLFWHARGSPFPTYLGCFVIIAAIAVDPFTQQILSYEQKPTQVPGAQSWVSRSQVFDNGSGGASSVGAVIGDYVAPTRDGPFEAAVISGVYDLVSPPPFNCPGASCTYPDFTSLGVCSKCRDVTAQTVKSCKSLSSGYPTQRCNFTTPGGFSPQAIAGNNAHNGFGYTLLNITVKVDRRESLVKMAIIHFAKEHAASDTHWQDTLTAYECSYDPCAKAYSGWTFVNGKVVPGAIQESRLNVTGIGSAGTQVPFTTVEKGFPGNTTFVINFLDLEAMTVALAKVFNAGIPGSNSFTAGLSDSPNLMRTVENIATGMSYRMLSGPNATVVVGEVFAVQTYMRTHWAWLSLTAALEAFACLFLISVIIATTRARQHAWKSSLAPMLYDDATIDE